MADPPSHKQAILDQLVSHAEQSIREDVPGSDWLAHILRKGFVGFENMQEPQLRRELELRGLSAPNEPDELEDDVGDDPDIGELLDTLPRDAS